MSSSEIPFLITDDDEFGLNDMSTHEGHLRIFNNRTNHLTYNVVHVSEWSLGLQQHTHLTIRYISIRFSDLT